MPGKYNDRDEMLEEVLKSSNGQVFEKILRAIKDSKIDSIKDLKKKLFGKNNTCPDLFKTNPTNYEECLNSADGIINKEDLKNFFAYFSR